MPAEPRLTKKGRHFGAGPFRESLILRHIRAGPTAPSGSDIRGIAAAHRGADNAETGDQHRLGLRLRHVRFKAQRPEAYLPFRGVAVVERQVGAAAAAAAAVDGDGLIGAVHVERTGVHGGGARASRIVRTIEAAEVVVDERDVADGRGERKVDCVAGRIIGGGAVVSASPDKTRRSRLPDHRRHRRPATRRRRGTGW